VRETQQSALARARPHTHTHTNTHTHKHTHTQTHTHTNTHTHTHTHIHTHIHTYTHSQEFEHIQRKAFNIECKAACNICCMVAMAKNMAPGGACECASVRVCVCVCVSMERNTTGSHSQNVSFLVACYSRYPVLRQMPRILINVCGCEHTYIHTYIRTYMLTYIHTYIHACIMYISI
jgi:hypothetical protein